MSIEYIFFASNNKLDVFGIFLRSRSLIGQILFDENPLSISTFLLNY